MLSIFMFQDTLLLIAYRRFKSNVKKQIFLKKKYLFFLVFKGGVYLWTYLKKKIRPLQQFFR